VHGRGEVHASRPGPFIPRHQADAGFSSPVGSSWKTSAVICLRGLCPMRPSSPGRRLLRCRKRIFPTIEPRLITMARTATVELVTVVLPSRGRATALPIRSYQTIHQFIAVTVVHRSKGKATAVPIRSYRTIHASTAIPIPSVFACRHTTG
jgi:hypothetical protein